ncbi:MAG: putative viral replication protein [Circoviridae sp.]|nr:MAG: putative viral replication protein [Circoviridae sp.]
MTDTLEHTKTRGEGNTRNLANDKKIKKSRAFSWTLNNYTDSGHTNTVNTLENTECEYIIGKEIGSNGTPHLQGYTWFKNARSFEQVKNILGNDKIHIEKSKGNKRQNFDYCIKDGNYVTNMKLKVKMIPKKVRDPLENKKLFPFQQEVINLVKNHNFNDDRTINWFWEPIGNVGKSALCKHLALVYDCLIVGGKSADIYNAVLNWKQEKGDFPTIMIVDIPRVQQDYVNYGAIEKLKDGLFYSGKYEGGQVCMNSPLIICFSNDEPDTTTMSNDRWKIKRIRKEESNTPKMRLI